MVTSRLFYDNLLTQPRFNSFTVAGGAVSMAASTWSPFYHFAVGSVLVEGQGTYTGATERDYLIEIQVGGTFANTRWRWSDQGGPPWNQENLVPQDGVWVTLSFSMQVRFVAGAFSPQFVVGDYHYARALRPYGIVKALDNSRNTEYRSGTMPSGSTLRIGFDLGSARQPEFVALADHNLPSSASVTLFGHATTLFTESGGFSQTIPWQATQMQALVSTIGSSQRYWWFRIVMGASPLTYLSFSQLCLAVGTTLALPPSIGYGASDQWLTSLDLGRVSRGLSPRVYSARTLQLTWEQRKEDAANDGGKLEAAWRYARGHPSYQLPSFWFVLDDSQVSTATLYAWSEGISKTHSFLDRFEYVTRWGEVIRTVAL